VSTADNHKTPKHSWTVEKLLALNLRQLKVVQENAQKKGATDLIEMCAEALASRKPSTNKAVRQSQKETGDIVTEYHFVCRNDRGVTFNSDGTFWSTSWVVAENVLKKSLKHGAKLALHNSKLEPSYRHGSIREYRLVDDFAEGKVESRIDFLIEPDNQPLEWAGSGTGEKGYKRARSAGNGVVLDSEPGDAS
jgi:hypothetical protein